MSEKRRPAKPQPRLQDFPHRVSDTVRYGDMDVQGHVNNTVIAQYFETGRVVMFREAEIRLGTRDVAMVLAHTEISFLRELRWPATIEIGTGVTDVGRSSYTLAHGVFQGEDCIAFGKATMVMIDHTTRRATPLTENFIARLAEWKYHGE